MLELPRTGYGERMIGGLLELIRAQVLAPQTVAPTPAERRVWLDPDNAPLNVQASTAEVVGLTSTPINPEIGSGFGGTAGGTMTLRHMAALVVAIEGADREHPAAVRDVVVSDLLRRALRVDWVNATIADDQEVSKVGVTVDYADIEEGNTAAYATLVFTVDVEWTV